MALAGHNNGSSGRRRWFLWAIGIVVAVVLLASFMSRDDSVPVRAAVVARGTVRSLISTNGKVESLQSFEAHAPLGTTVKKLLVKEGDHVKKGQLLAQLDDAQVRSQTARAQSLVSASQADLSAIESGGVREEVLTVETQLVKARSARDAAQRNLDALQRLQQKGAASPGEVKNVEDELQRATADVKLLEQKQKDRYSRPEIERVKAQQTDAQSAYAAAEDLLSQMHIRAPFDGVVYSVAVHEGAYVNPGDLVLQEADLSKVVVRAFVDEPDVGRLSPGQKIEVTWDALPGRLWEGSVSAIPATLKLRGTRNVGETTCVVDNHDFKLLPNVNVGVTIITAEHQGALTVPREAIRQDDHRIYVFEIVNNELHRRDIQTSLSNLTQVEVTSGLQDNASVALSLGNSKPLHDGLAVRVVQ